MDKRQKYILGLCIGTSSAKALMTDMEGNVRSSSEVLYGIDSPLASWTEQDPQVWFESSVQAIKDLLCKYPAGKEDFLCLGISGQMHSTVFLDRDNTVIRPAILWNDQRTTAECKYLLENIGLKKILEFTSNRPINSFSLPKILWLKNNEYENFKRLRKFCLSKDYIKLRFSGALSTDPSDASGTLCYDLKNGTWSEDMVKEAGLNADILPDITPSIEFSGFLSKEMAQVTGLPSGLPIITGVADTAGEMIGNNIHQNGDCLVKLGTGGDLLVYNEDYIKNDGSFDLFKYPGNGFYVIQVTLSATSSQNWALHNIGLDQDTLSESMGKEMRPPDLQNQTDRTRYAYIEEQIAKIEPGANGLLFLPYMIGERSPYFDPDAKGALIGLHLNSSKNEIFRSVLEGVCFSLRDCYQLLMDKGYKTNKIIVSGGGAKSALWCQILSDVMDAKVIKMSTDEGPSLGVCILGAVASNIYATVDDASRNFLKVKKTYKPIQDHASKYHALYEIYHGLYGNLKETFQKISNFVVKYNT
jgi:xylulokinase